jgi:prefoldin subunit 5
MSINKKHYEQKIMDNTSKLEQLIAQRKEIDRRINELANPKYEVDGARMLLKKYKTDKSDEWVVTLEEIDGAQGKSSAYKQIISAKSCNDAIEYIESQIATLQALLDKVRESIRGVYEN